MSATDGVARIAGGLCVRGHELRETTKVNTYGAKYCGECARENRNARYYRTKALDAGEEIPEEYQPRARGGRPRVSTYSPSRTLPAFCTSVEEFLREAERKRVAQAKARFGT